MVLLVIFIPAALYALFANQLTYSVSSDYSHYSKFIIYIMTTLIFGLVLKIVLDKPFGEKFSLPLVLFIVPGVTLMCYFIFKYSINYTFPSIAHKIHSQEITFQARVNNINHSNKSLWGVAYNPVDRNLFDYWLQPIKTGKSTARKIKPNDIILVSGSKSVFGFQLHEFKYWPNNS